MSEPNPPRRRVVRRRWYDERIWRDLYAACLVRSTPDVAALHADEAYSRYRERFPQAAAALEPDTEAEADPGQKKEKLQ